MEKCENNKVKERKEEWTKTKESERRKNRRASERKNEGERRKWEWKMVKDNLGKEGNRDVHLWREREDDNQTRKEEEEEKQDIQPKCDRGSKKRIEGEKNVVEWGVENNEEKVKENRMESEMTRKCIRKEKESQ